MATSKSPAKKTAAVKKPAATKTVVKKVVAKKSVQKKATTAKNVAKPRNIGAEERYRMIEVAAYYIAERNGFRGNAFDYWVAAEAEISEKIGK